MLIMIEFIIHNHILKFLIKNMKIMVNKNIIFKDILMKDFFGMDITQLQILFQIIFKIHILQKNMQNHFQQEMFFHMLQIEIY